MIASQRVRQVSWPKGGSMRLLIGVLVLVISSSSVPAQPNSKRDINRAPDFPAHEVARGCRLARDRNVSESGYTLLIGECMGILYTLTGLGSHLQENMRSCFPSGGNLDQAEKVFLKYVDDHPERLHEEALLLAIAACHAA